MTRRNPSQYNYPTLSFDQTWLNKHYSPINGVRKKFVVIHHMTVKGTGNGSALDACYRIWQDRPASAHYGVDGELIRQFVRDKDFAWATGDNAGNLYGISLELANSTLGPKWGIGTETWNTAALLTAWIHVVHKMGRPVKNKTVRKHKSFTATACPGPYMDDTWNKFVAECQRIYDQITKPKKTEAEKKRDQVKAGNAAAKRSRKKGKKVQARRIQNGTDWRDGTRTKVGKPAQKAITTAAKQAGREGRPVAAKRLRGLAGRIKNHRKAKKK